MGHLTFVSKRLSAVGNERILQIFDSAREARSRFIALVNSTWIFLLLSFYIVLYNNQINARALIGQSAMVYCAGKPMEKSRVLRIII